MTTDERVVEIMKENNMNTKDNLLVMNCAIIYVTAQRDLLVEQVNQQKETK
jgi:hypothetical protein